MDLKDHIRLIPDFPKPGILYLRYFHLVGPCRRLAGGTGSIGENG